MHIGLFTGVMHFDLDHFVYDLVSKYNATTGEYEGVRERTTKDKHQLDDAEHNIQDNLDNNAKFGEDSINEIKQITTLSNLITSKYLGNLKELMVNIHKAPQGVIMSLRGLPEHLDQLKMQIKNSISDPLLSQYTSPLQKLYRSLTDIDEQTSTVDIELPSVPFGLSRKRKVNQTLPRKRFAL